MTTACPHCGIGLSEGTLCRDGAVSLMRMLDRVPDVLVDLADARDKQVRFTTNGRRSSSGQPLPLDVNASHLIRDLERMMRTYAVTCALDIAPPWAVEPVPTSASSCARFLRSRVPHRRLWSLLGDLYEEVASTLPDAVEVIDVPRARRYLGLCSPDADPPCTAVVWATEGEGIAFCPSCGSACLVDARLDALSARVQADITNRVMTATDAAHAVVAAGLVQGDPAKVAQRIRRAASPRQNPLGPDEPPIPAVLTSPMTVREPGKRARPGYRISDVLTVLKKGA